jgi:predicted Fe-Mo cluster-binding NifX family protein
MKAKIAVTCNKNGDKLAEHAGHAVYFKIYEIDEVEGLLGAKVIKVEKEFTIHNLIHNPEINKEEHEVLQSQILLTGGIGMGAINKLYQLGIRAYIIEEKNPDEAVNQLINGTLKAVDPNSIEHNHRHEHGDDHDCHGHQH